MTYKPNRESSGKFSIRCPKWLHQELAETANEEGQSMNDLVIGRLSEFLAPNGYLHFIQNQVNESLENAIKENGYTEMASWNPVDIAVDLCKYDSELEKFTPSEVLPLVKDYFKRTRLELQNKHGVSTEEVSTTHA